MSWREQIRAARGIVHETMSLVCLHVTPDGGTQNGQRVRYHYSRGALGSLPGSDGYGERLANATSVVFDQRDFVPSQNDLLVFESGEVLQVGPVMPPDVRTDFREADVAQLERAAYGRYPFLKLNQPWAGLTPPVPLVAVFDDDVYEEGVYA